MRTRVVFFRFECVSWPISYVPPNLSQKTSCMTEAINQQSSWCSMVGLGSWKLREPILTWNKRYSGHISVTACSIKLTRISGTGVLNLNSASFVAFRSKMRSIWRETSTYISWGCILYVMAKWVCKPYLIRSQGWTGAWDRRFLSVFAMV